MEATRKTSSLKALLSSAAAVFAIAICAAMPQAAWAAETVTTEAQFKAAALAGDDIVLGDNLTLLDTVLVEEDINIDLGGYTLSTNDGDYGLRLSGAEVLIENGTIESTSHLIRVGDGSNLTLAEGVMLESKEGCCVVVVKNSTLTTYADMVSYGAFAAVSGNGSDGNGGVTVNIAGGSIVSNDVAVYFPNTTNLNISGGYIEGTSAVYVKSGKLNITGGEMYAYGDCVDYVHNGNGCDATGDTIIIEACDYPGGVPTVSISGGAFTSDNAGAIGYYQQSEDYELANTQFVSGGTFYDDDFSAITYLADGYALFEDSSNWTVYVMTEEKAKAAGMYRIIDGAGFVFYTNDETVLNYVDFYETIQCAVMFKYINADESVATVVEYVTFGSTLSEDQIPTVPEREGYKFTNWAPETSVVVTDATMITAEYEKVAAGGTGTEGTEGEGTDSDAKNDGKESVDMKEADGGKGIAQTGDSHLAVIVAAIVALSGCALGCSRIMMRRDDAA